VRGDRNSRSAISPLVRPRLASMTIWRCCGVRSASAPGAVPAAWAVTPQARSSASARRVQGMAPRLRGVSRAAAGAGLASLMRRSRRSDSP
jgi:hypothetical protein